MTQLTRRLLAGAAAFLFATAAWAQQQKGTVDVIPPWAIPGKAQEPAPAATPSPTAPTTSAPKPAPGGAAPSTSPAPEAPRTAPDPSADPVAVPRVARVSDAANLLSASQRQALEQKLEAFERSRGAQVAVVTVPTLGFETIEEFAGRVTDEWQLGRKGVDDGVLFVIAVQDRKLRIHTGRGVQGTLTDVLSKRIVSDIVAPRFRTGDYAGGIDAGVDAIFKAIEGENLPLPQQRGGGGAAQSPGGGFGLGSIPILLVAAFFVIPIVGGILRSMFGRFFGAVATAGLMGVGGTILLGSLLIGIVAAVIGFFFTLLGGLGVGRAVGRHGRGPVFIPGGFGGGGGGWGGGGGFSGGGGGFDGGGASGSW